MTRITFKINGVKHSVGSEISSDVTLLDYIRNYAELRGTKYMCREAGCGACIVSVVKKTGELPVSVNACLVSITSCQNWEITTIEKVGNKLDGYHALQTTIAKLGATQCGYCTPGWIMAMYSLIEKKEQPTMLEIEKAFGSNICRCTGYRPILDAFKQFAKDAPEKLLDIEDMSLCEKGGGCCKNSSNEDGWCMVTREDLQKNTLELTLSDGKKWFRVYDVKQIFAVLYSEGDDSYMLIHGNTAKGAVPKEYPQTLIDISQVSELKGYTLDQNLTVQAGTTLTEFMDICKEIALEDGFSYLEKVYDHVDLVAHIPVRNLGSIAGNLMIKHEHNEFQSDIYLLFETVGAELVIESSDYVQTTVSMQDFLTTDMKSKVILSVILPPLGEDYKFVSFKIMPRAQSTHALVNAGFLYKVDKNNVVQEARIVYGALSEQFIRAEKTEAYLAGKNLFSDTTLKGALGVLEAELVVTDNPPEPSAAFRKRLAVNLFYKGLLSIAPTSILNSRFRSGATKLHESRGVSSGRQIYETNPTLYPLNQPVEKLEALIQASGEAPYVEDIPKLPNEVYAEFVLSTEPLGTIVSIDASKALELPGVIAFYSAEDIPGLNSFTPGGSVFWTTNEEVLCSGEVKYNGQPIGIVVAESRAIANKAAKLVTAEYSNVKEPVTDIKVAKEDSSRNTLASSTDATATGTDVMKTIKGSNTIYSQYHFAMETIVCVTKPVEGDSLEVYTPTQYMDAVQVLTAKMLDIPENKVDVHTRRLGGSYGVKISRAAQVALGCNLVVHKLNRPCRFIQPLTTNLKAVGKRFPCHCDFEVSVSSSGQIQSMNYNIYEDNGHVVDEVVYLYGIDAYMNCYDISRWNYKCFNTVTDTASHTFCRSPGTLEQIGMTEYIMEQISYELSLDPVDVRLANLDTTNYAELKDMLEDLKTKSDYTKRMANVESFNSANRWKKRGLRFAFLRWAPLGSIYLNITVSVYQDGSVAITHGAIEMGQGINTKVAQVCAYTLGVSLDKVNVKENNTIIAPNGFATGGSISSQTAALGVQKACKELLKRLEPIKAELGNPTWEELIAKAFASDMNLQAHGFTNSEDVQQYNILGLTLAEVELDVLTGEFEVIRVDMLHDVGQSVNPLVDIGQIEGAFVMGMGYWSCEEIIYSTTGEVLTDRAWNYRVPQARDIPQDFRIYFKKNSYSNDTILGSKGVGEPPICMSIVIPFAIRAAIVAAREESGLPANKWFAIDGPYTTEKICLAVSTNTTDLKFA